MLLAETVEEMKREKRKKKRKGAESSDKRNISELRNRRKERSWKTKICILGQMTSSEVSGGWKRKSARLGFRKKERVGGAVRGRSCEKSQEEANVSYRTVQFRIALFSAESLSSDWKLLVLW